MLFEITASNTLLETQAPGYRAVPGEERGEFGFVAVFAALLGRPRRGPSAIILPAFLYIWRIPIDAANVSDE